MAQPLLRSPVRVPLNVAIVPPEVDVEAGLGLRRGDLGVSLGPGNCRYLGHGVVQSIVLYHLEFPKSRFLLLLHQSGVIMRPDALGEQPCFDRLSHFVVVILYTEIKGILEHVL